MRARERGSAGFLAAGTVGAGRPGADPESGIVTAAPREIGAGHVLGGRYVLERPLAAGGMGQVWIARHDALDRLVAVKLMSADTHGSEVLRHRFEREAKACAQLRSPHVVQVFDYGHEGGVPFLVMELLEGEDLAALQHERSRFSPAEVAALIGEAASGLREAHELGIVHRDIKLSNLFLSRAGAKTCLKILDFGVARVSELSGRSVTAVDVRLGTTSYMSPEQLVSHDVDTRADVWSLAVVAFRLLTGHAPFPGDTPMLVAQRIAYFQRSRVAECAPDLSARWDELFDCAFARPITSRFQTVEALASALARLVAEEAAPVSAPVTPPVEPSRAMPVTPSVSMVAEATAWRHTAGPATDATLAAGAVDVAEPATVRTDAVAGAQRAGAARRVRWVVSAVVVVAVAAVGVATISRVLRHPSALASSSGVAADQASPVAAVPAPASAPSSPSPPPHSASDAPAVPSLTASGATPEASAPRPRASAPDPAAVPSEDRGPPAATSGPPTRRGAAAPLPARSPLPEPPREPPRDLLDSPQ